MIPIVHPVGWVVGGEEWTKPSDKKKGPTYCWRMDKQNSGWLFPLVLYFHPYLGKIPILTNIFQRGWNHQLQVELMVLTRSLQGNYLSNVGIFFWVFVSEFQVCFSWMSSEIGMSWMFLINFGGFAAILRRLSTSTTCWSYATVISGNTKAYQEYLTIKPPKKPERFKFQQTPPSFRTQIETRCGSGFTEPWLCDGGGERGFHGENAEPSEKKPSRSGQLRLFPRRRGPNAWGVFGWKNMQFYINWRYLKCELLNVRDEVLLIFFEMGSSSCKINV